jgi:anti-sigma B factor antagonist
MLLEIRESTIDGVAVLELNGKLALGRESQRIETLVDDFARRQVTRVIFDLTGVNYIDSAGIGLLALAAGKLKEGGGKLVVVSPAANRATQLLKLTQMNAIVPLCETMAEAMGAFGLAQPPASA